MKQSISLFARSWAESRFNIFDICLGRLDNRSHMHMLIIIDHGIDSFMVSWLGGLLFLRQGRQGSKLLLRKAKGFTLSYVQHSRNSAGMSSWSRDQHEPWSSSVTSHSLNCYPGGAGVHSPFVPSPLCPTGPAFSYLLSPNHLLACLLVLGWLVGMVDFGSYVFLAIVTVSFWLLADLLLLASWRLFCTWPLMLAHSGWGLPWCNHVYNCIHVYKRY